jgi:cysteine-rich repeat protein
MESCDDGNNDLGDGCTPLCTLEPDCSGGACKTTCGDGIVLGNLGEECDDGNAISGDGCSSTCKVEQGYQCKQPPLGDSMLVPVVYRDFKLVRLAPRSATMAPMTAHTTTALLGANSGRAAVMALCPSNSERNVTAPLWMACNAVPTAARKGSVEMPSLAQARSATTASTTAATANAALGASSVPIVATA